MPRDFTPEVRLARAKDLWILFGGVFALIVVRLVDLQLIQGATMARRAEDNRIYEEVVRAERGRILDRDGELLADSYPAFRLSFDPRDRFFTGRPESLRTVVKTLAEIVGQDPEELFHDVERARTRWGEPFLVDRDLSFAGRSQIEERMSRLPGVEIQPESMRRYPGGRLACHVLGHLGEISEAELEDSRAAGYQMKDLVGRAGVEKEYEAFLRGRNGVAWIEVDAFGRRTRLFGEAPVDPPTAGNDLVLTLDIRLQEVAERALEAIPPHGRPYPRGLPPAGSVDSTSRPAAASLVALDPRNGEILALASRPPFDPNLFVRGLTSDEWREVSGGRQPLLNRAVQSAYPPGSVFKVATALIALEEGVITTQKTFAPCDGAYYFGNRFFRCWKREGHGRLDLANALMRSCDVYFYQVGIALGIGRLGWGAERMHLAEATGIDLPQERTGLVPTPEWYAERYGKGGVGPGVALNVAIGQGELLLTPLAMARFTAAVANGGRLVRPHLLRSIQDGEGRVIQRPFVESTAEERLLVSPDHLAAVREAMERVVMIDGGTGGQARVAGFRIAGKTGTAQNPHGDDHALFVCFAPVEDPTIAIAVVAEESGHGGSVAAPVAQRVLEMHLTGRLPGEDDLAVEAIKVWEGD